MTPIAYGADGRPSAYSADSQYSTMDTPRADASAGQSSNWSSIIGGVIGGAVRGYTAVDNKSRANQARTTQQQQPNWLWLGLIALGVVLLVMVGKK